MFKLALTLTLRLHDPTIAFERYSVAEMEAEPAPYTVTDWEEQPTPYTAADFARALAETPKCTCACKCRR